MKVDRVSAPDELRSAVDSLSKQLGLEFILSEAPVPGTNLYVVYTLNHPLPEKYTATAATLGFRVPGNFPDAGPEDSFFLQPDTIRLIQNDPVSHVNTLNRASPNGDVVKGTALAGSVLVFSWHCWEKHPWGRSKHTLIDHYAHCIRRFDAPEHD
jgi:hypothetical protein